MLDAVATERELKVLFERALDGDQTVYHKFLCKIGDILRSYVQRQLFRLKRSECDAEDIVQEVLLAIHAKRHVYDRGVPVTAWAHAIARYRLIDFLRATNRESRNLSFDEVEDITGDDGAAIDTILTVRKLVAHLPENLRQPLELMKLKGFSVREIAIMTGTSEASVKVNVHRGLKALAQGSK